MRFILGVLLAAVAFFVWGFFYWGISPLMGKVVQPFADAQSEAAVAAQLTQSLGKTGVYKYPAPPADMNDEAAVAEFERKHNEGPLYMLFYQQGGAAPMSQQTMIYGFLHSVLLCFVGGLIIMAASPRAYMNRVMLIFWVAVFGTVWSEFGNVVWWNYPMNWCWLEMGYHIGGGLIIGIILAGFIRPDPEMA